MLPADASPASHLRLQYAQQLAAQCPPSLFTEIALTGSSARGLATDQSDIEINFWVQQIPPATDRAAWLASIGVTDIHAHDHPRSDGSIWIDGRYHGIDLEAGWQTFADLESSLNDLLRAATTDHKTLRLADLILTAIPLRGTQNLVEWQQRLANYPPELAQKLSETVFAAWLAQDWDRALPESETTIAQVWRVLYAANHRWEINWKYAPRLLSELERYPPDLLSLIAALRAAQTSHATAKALVTLVEAVLPYTFPLASRASVLEKYRDLARILAGFVP